MMTQYITSNVHEAAIAKYVGYKVRFLAAENQWVIQNPGDLDDLWADVRAGKQGIADGLGLLKAYDELHSPQSTITTPQGDKQELVKADIPTVPGKTWATHDIPTASILSLRGYELVDIEWDGQSATFIFAYDDDLKNIIAQFNKRELLVEPHALDVTGYEIRKRLREQRGY
jgi:hypothetical protein